MFFSISLLVDRRIRIRQNKLQGIRIQEAQEHRIRNRNIAIFGQGKKKNQSNSCPRCLESGSGVESESMIDDSTIRQPMRGFGPQWTGSRTLLGRYQAEYQGRQRQERGEENDSPPSMDVPKKTPRALQNQQRMLSPFLPSPFIIHSS